MHLKPEAKIRDFGEGPGVLIHGVNTFRQLEDGERLSLLAGDVAVTRALDDKEREVTADRGVESKPILRRGEQWPACEGCAIC